MGKKAFTEKNGVFHLTEDTPDNRTKLNKRITEIIQKEGNKKSIKSITYGPDKKPYRVSTKSITSLLAGKADSVKITTVNVNRPEAETRPGAKVREGSKAFERTDELTKAFEKRISGILNHTPQRLKRYYSELNREIRQLHLFVAKRNKELKAAGADESQLVSRGHYSRLSKSVDSPRNLWLELMVPNKVKGNRYSPNPGAMRAIGNPIKEGIDPVENWTRDYVTWLDRPENGGSGILPQRGDYSPLMEQKFNLITGEQWETLSAKDKLKANDVINDLVRDQEKLNQWLPSEGVNRRKWGLLTPDQASQAQDIAAEFAEENNNGKYNGDITTNGKTKTNGLNIGKGIGTRKVDNAINFGVAVGTGNYGQAAVSAMSIGAAEALKSKAAQKFAAEQMIKIGAKRGGKTALKLIPGVDIAISAQEAWSYLRQGKLDQAGIAALSGAVGWVPLSGDAISAGLDLTNTGIDIARLHVNNTDKNKKKLETDTPTKSTVRRAKIKY